MTPGPTPREADEHPFVVAVGASGAEGLDDLKTLLADLPSGLAAVVLIVLHRPSDRLSELRAVLSRASKMPVLVASEGERFCTGCCYIGEPDAHLSLAARSDVRLVEGGNNSHRNRTIDLLFGSVAKYARQRGIGVVLSGSLDDGSRGLEAIANAGGTTMVITKAGLPEQGMPWNAAHYDGPVDVMGSGATIAREIAQRVRSADL